MHLSSACLCHTCVHLLIREEVTDSSRQPQEASSYHDNSDNEGKSIRRRECCISSLICGTLYVMAVALSRLVLVTLGSDV